jgi:hypothetical protein
MLNNLTHTQSNVFSTVANDRSQNDQGFSRVPERFRSITLPNDISQIIISRKSESNIIKIEQLVLHSSMQNDA